jgi:hypothetical protein
MAIRDKFSMPKQNRGLSSIKFLRGDRFKREIGTKFRADLDDNSHAGYRFRFWGLQTMGRAQKWEMK